MFSKLLRQASYLPKAQTKKRKNLAEENLEYRGSWKPEKIAGVRGQTNGEEPNPKKPKFNEEKTQSFEEWESDEGIDYGPLDEILGLGRSHKTCFVWTNVTFSSNSIFR